MTGFGLLALLFLVVGATWLFLVTPPARLAGMMTAGLPVGLIAIGGLLTFLGRGAIGIPIVAFGLALWQRNRSASRLSGGRGRISTVRSAALEMQLDHDSGDMDGNILTGRFEGSRLSALDDAELFELYGEVSADADSAGLLEAYLDRRIPGWREDTQAHTASGQGGAPGSGAMTEQEAYQVLGLEPGATPDEIRKAWRRLMKGMHPDSGGSAFLAAKINMAKDILLD